MNKKAFGYAALALLLSTAAAAQNPAAAPAPKLKISEKARTPISELQSAVNAKDAANIPAKLAAAKAAAQTPDEKYAVAQLQLKAAVGANDDAAIAAAIDGVAQSGYLDAAKTAELYVSLGSKYFGQKQYAQAAALFERAATINPSDSKLQLMIADTRMAEGRKADAAAIYDRAIKASQTAGQKPQESLYKRAVQAAYDAKTANLNDLARQWVTAYPNAESWRNSIAIYRNQTSPDMEGTLDLLRLMRAAGALNKSNDLSLYVSVLADRANFIEAQRALEQASQTPGLDPAGLQSLKATVAGKPKVTAADLAAAAKSAQSATALLRVGDRYYGLGEYAKAAETYRAAKAKGAEAGLADLRTGVALAGAGDVPGATAALKSVSGSRAGIAQYWLLYLQTKG